LESVLKSDIFVREIVRVFAAREVDGGHWWGRFSCDGCLMGWRAVDGVLEDSWRPGELEIGERGGKKHGYIPFGRFAAEGLGGV
jgi:hypothetical protein